MKSFLAILTLLGAIVFLQLCEVNSCELPAPLTCDYELKYDHGISPCDARCWHNKWETRDDWCQRYGHSNYRFSFDSRMGGKCYCCNCKGNSNGKC